METLKNFEIGVDGRTTKLDNIVYGIRFARHYYEDRDPSQVSYQQASSLLDDIRMWQSTLGKHRRAKAQHQLENLSETSLDLANISEVIECENMWAHFHRVVSMCIVGDPGLSQKDLKLAMGAVMVTTMLKSW